MIYNYDFRRELLIVLMSINEILKEFSSKMPLLNSNMNYRLKNKNMTTNYKVLHGL